ncbi:P-loop containing nucleoside triphosphate hydrolase protein, partial [Sparassis latifolia]
YLDKNFEAKNKADQTLIDDTVKNFSLNTDQERALRIIANHATDPSGEQLKMYLGGMAGTGKSQVIKALIHFFDERKEGYQFMCVAPTGSAAAHSMLGFGKFGDSQTSLMQVRARLLNVDYIFVDEVSMVDCNSMYNICAKM